MFPSDNVGAFPNRIIEQVVLMASVEQEGDSRAMQAEAVLKTLRQKLRDAHIRIYRQDARHRNLFFAYFELKERAEAGGE